MEETLHELQVISDESVMVEVLKSFTTPEEIEALEGELLRAETVKIPVKHTLWKGGYARQITLPKGIIAIGHAHSDECLNIVISGSVSVVINCEVKRIEAPCQFVSPPLGRKIGFVHEDCTWITVHATDKTDIAELEAELIIKSPTFQQYELEKGEESTAIVNCPRDEFWVDRIDYFNALREIGITHKEVRAITENKSDQVPFPAGTDLVYLGSSEIQGTGLFASFTTPKGTALCPARIGTKRTPAGRYTNHSRYPNCKFEVTYNGDVNLVATLDILEGQELTVDYRQAKQTATKADEVIQFNTQ